MLTVILLEPESLDSPPHTSCLRMLQISLLCSRSTCLVIMILNIALLGLVPTTCRMSFKLLHKAHYILYLLSWTDLIHRFGKAGSDAADWEKATWPFLKDLAEKHPEAGLHFRGMWLCEWFITDLDGVIDQKQRHSYIIAKRIRVLMNSYPNWPEKTLGTKTWYPMYEIRHHCTSAG